MPKTQERENRGFPPRLMAGHESTQPQKFFKTVRLPFKSVPAVSLLSLKGETAGREPIQSVRSGRIDEDSSRVARRT